MGVDGIGGPRGPLTPPASGVQNRPSEGRAVAGSSVGGVDAAAAPSASSVGAAAHAAGAELERVRLARGEISLEQYLDHEVLRATSHLEPRATPAMLEAIRGALKEELSSDPLLLALANRISAG